MDRVVWKFPIDNPNTAAIKGTPLHIGLDPRTQRPAVWCLCDATNTTEQERPLPFVIVMTGDPVPPEAMEYVTTVAGIEGWIVAHFFRRLPQVPEVTDPLESRA